MPLLTKLKDSMTFQDLGLEADLVRALVDRGYVEPTEIQAQAVPLLISKDTDFIGQAQTGTGKTAAFALPMLHKIEANSRGIQALVLAPTRELANQIQTEIAKFAVHKRIRTFCVYGGTQIGKQIGDFKRTDPQILIGTPGRVLDLIRRGVLKFSGCKVAVLDEADEMLDMGFLDDVRDILDCMQTDYKTWMFSATMPREIQRLINDYLTNPEKIAIEKKTLSNADIEQQYYLVRPSDMPEAITRLLETMNSYYAIIFCRTKIDTKNLSDALNARGFTADCLNGDMSQDQRDSTMARFKRRNVDLLVCTDVAARGIDIDDLTHVVNFGLPLDNESYVHRIGRTGRAGQKGIAISLVAPQDERKLRFIERMTKARVEKKQLPTAQETRDALIGRLSARVIDSSSEADLNDPGLGAFAASLETMQRDDLVRALYKLNAADKLEHLKRREKLDAPERGGRSRTDAAPSGRRGERGPRDNSRGGRDDRMEKDGRNTRPGFSRLVVNVGRNTSQMPFRQFLSGFARELDVQERFIQNMDMGQDATTFDVPDRFVDRLVSTRGIVFGEQTLRLDKTAPVGNESSAPASKPRTPRPRARKFAESRANA